MKLIVTMVGILGVISTANACTDFSGEYLDVTFKTLNFEQKGCESVVLTYKNYGGEEVKEIFTFQPHLPNPDDSKDFRIFDGNELSFRTTLIGCEVISLDVGSYRKTYFGALLLNEKYTSYKSKNVLELENNVLIKIK